MCVRTIAEMCMYGRVCTIFPSFYYYKSGVCTEEYKNSIDFIYFFPVPTHTQSGVSVRLNFFDHREKVLSYQKVLPVRSQMLYG